MTKTFLRLILIQLISLASSLGFAANEYGQPMIYSGPSVNYGHCKIVRIHSVTELGGKVYSQSGVGWFVAAEEGYRILTPSHVVSGADLIIGECLGVMFPVQLQSRSETLDLALLKPSFSVTDFASPLIFLKKRSQVLADSAPYAKAAILSMQPDHFDSSLETKIKAQVANSYQIPGYTSDKPVIQVKTYDGEMGKVGSAHFDSGLDSLVAETLAITPGYSGAPLFAHLAKENFNDDDFLINTLTGGDYTSLYLMGMLTKTEINGSRSLGISLPMILKALPLLMSTQNSELDVYAKTLNPNWRLKYRNDIINKTLERSRELIYESTGSARKSFSEVCEDDTLESSEWNPTLTAPVSLKDQLQNYKKLQIDKNNPAQMKKILDSFKIESDKTRAVEQKSSGGDYGEGGGSTQALKHSHLMTVDPTLIYHRGGYQMASYKRDKPCEKVRIQDNLGNQYDSINFQGRIEKATSLTEAYDLLSRGGQWTSAKGASLCKSYKLINTIFGGFISTYYQVADKEYLHIRSDGISIPQSQGTESPVLGSLVCNGNQIELQLEQDNLKIKAHLGDAKNPSGFIQLQNSSCMVPLTTKNYTLANPWKHQIRSPLLDVDISLGTEGRILSIKILRAADQCSERRGDNLWLLESHFYEQQAMNDKYIQFKALIQNKRDRK